MVDLRERAIELSQDFADHARSVRESATFVQVVLVLGGAATVAVAQCATLPAAGPWPLWTILGLIGTAIAFIGGVFAFAVAPSGAQALATAQRTLEDAREAQADAADLPYFVGEIRRATELYEAVTAMRTALESMASSTEGCPANPAQPLLDVAERALRVVLGFQTADHWTLGVYQMESTLSGRELVCCAQIRSTPCKLEDARRWAEGRGAGWMALASGRPVIIPDTQSEGLGTIFEGVLSTRDTSRYRSVVAVPVYLSGPTREKWGAVVATSDQEEHFPLNPGPGVHPIEAVRALAGMITLGLAVRRRQDGTRRGSKHLEPVMNLAQPGAVHDGPAK